MSQSQATPVASVRTAVLVEFLWCLLFAFAHTQSPLYYSNQHQYFLHGLAWAGYGYLDADWLATTVDPTPLFSGLVAVSYRVFGDWSFQVYYALILAAYAALGWAVYRLVLGPAGTPIGRFVFLALITLVHWAPLRLASARGLGCDYPWYFQSGVAGQYILGPGLQPSVAGVLLLAAVVLAARQWWFTAVLVAALACWIHSTYLLPAAFLTLACMALTWKNGKLRSVLLGMVSLLSVLPVLVYDLLYFAPTSSQVFVEAQRIIAHERIPHHTQISRWFDVIAALQYLWIIVGIVWAGHTNLRRIMAVTLGLSALLTFVQWATANDSLALAFPWRITAVLLPLATMIVLARLANILSQRVAPTRLRTISSYGLVIMAGGGLLMIAAHMGYFTTPDELSLLEFVREQAQPGQTYLIPVEIPRHDKAKRGSVSTTFTSPPRRDGDHGLISVDLQRFRLYTGVPIYVDFKSIPYKDSEVLEWWQRLNWARDLYQVADWSNPLIREELHRRRITHVVVPRRQIRHGIGPLLYLDDHYAAFAVSPP